MSGLFQGYNFTENNNKRKQQPISMQSFEPLGAAFGQVVDSLALHTTLIADHVPLPYDVLSKFESLDLVLHRARSSNIVGSFFFLSFLLAFIEIMDSCLQDEANKKTEKESKLEFTSKLDHNNDLFANLFSLERKVRYEYNFFFI